MSEDVVVLGCKIGTAASIELMEVDCYFLTEFVPEAGINIQAGDCELHLEDGTIRYYNEKFEVILVNDFLKMALKKGLES